MGSPTQVLRAARKRHGRHYTPPVLARFLARRLLAQLPRPDLSGTLRVLDPACGDGELLLSLHREVSARFPGVRVEPTGFDLDETALAVARGRAEQAGIEVDWHAGDFLAEARSLPDNGFDAIITNPPYVRTQQLGGATARLLAEQFGLRGRIDLTHPFVAVAPRLLRPGGTLGLLCANRFLTTRAGANIRAILHDELAPVELYDLGDTRLFEAAVLPAITIATRTDARPECRFVSAYEIPGAAAEVPGGDLFEALTGATESRVAHNGRIFAVEVGRLWSAGASVPRRSEDTWRMSNPTVDTWLAGVAAGTWRTFGDVARIRVGIKTTADRVFISDRWDQMRPSPEPELLLDLITHHDLAPWRITRARDTRVLYPYDTGAIRRKPVDLAEFPGAAAYLDEHRPTLEGRRYVLDSGRDWFEIWVPQRPHLWRAPKLVFPDISERPRFALDRSGAVVNGDCYWISLADLDGDRLAHLLMGVANSALGLRYYDAVCGNRLYAGRRRWITQYVSRLPLPDPSTPAAARIVALVAEVMEGRAPDAATAAELDDLVAAAFGVQPVSAHPVADRDHGQQDVAGEFATGGDVVQGDEPVGGQRQRHRQTGHDLGDQIGVEGVVLGAQFA